MCLCACGPALNKRVTLYRNDKIPYGTYYAYNNLHYFFNDATIQTSNVSPSVFYEDDSGAAYIIIANTVKPDEEELDALLNYAVNGNHVFISSAGIGSNLLDSFHLKVSDEESIFRQEDSLTVRLWHPQTSDELSFTYPGKPLGNSFTEMDSSVTNILGNDREGHANFVKFTYPGGGSVSIHLAPATFTNFFLLHKDNKRYLDLAMSSIPDSVHQVRWDDYFRHHINGQDDSERSGFSKLSAFVNHPVLSWAFWLTLVLFAIIYLFESKRKQRPVPVVQPLRNASLDFVQTIGRLYYQRKDNKDLALKMSAHFLGHIRTKYNLSTNVTDELFAQKLSFKSGHPLDIVQGITSFINQIENKAAVSDSELLSFNNQIDQFYKQG